MKEKVAENTGIHVACFVVPGGYTQNPLEAPLFVDNSQNPLSKILDQLGSAEDFILCEVL